MEIHEIEIKLLRPNSYNPRKTFDEAKLRELSESIKTNGVLEPLIVRPKDGKFEIVAGERRFRASMLAGLEAVPCVARGLTDQEALEITVLENIQREDLNPIEEALGFQNLLSLDGWTEERIASEIGKSQPYISDRIRLLDLPDVVKDFITRAIFSLSHARLFSPIAHHPEIIEAIIEDLQKDVEKWGNGSPVVTVRELAGKIDSYITLKYPHLKPKLKWDNPPVFDVGPCQSCPHNVLIRTWNEEKIRRCLNPECWEKKQAAVEEEAKREMAERTEKTGIIDRSGLAWNSYERLGWVRFDTTECESCDKRKVSVSDPKDEELEPICLDPECCKRKKTAHTRKVNKERREKRLADISESAEKALEEIRRDNEALMARDPSQMHATMSVPDGYVRVRIEDLVEVLAACITDYDNYSHRCGWDYDDSLKSRVADAFGDERIKDESSNNIRTVLMESPAKLIEVFKFVALEIRKEPEDPEEPTEEESEE